MLKATNSYTQPTTMAVNLAGIHPAAGKEIIANEGTQKTSEKGKEILAQSSYSEEMPKKTHSYNLRSRIVNKFQPNSSPHSQQTTRSEKQEDTPNATREGKKGNKRTHQVAQEDASNAVKLAKRNKRTHQTEKEVSTNTIRFVQPATTAVQPTTYPANDWRKTLSADESEEMIKKITEVLVECLGPGAVNDPKIRVMAKKYEDSVVQWVGSKEDYSEKIAAKLYNMRQKNALKQSAVPVRLEKQEDTSNAVELAKRNKGTHPTEQEVSTNTIGSVQLATTAVQPTANPEDDWRKTLFADERERMIQKIMEVIVTCSGTHAVNDPKIRVMATKYEESVVLIAGSRTGYFEYIATKLYDMRQKNALKQYRQYQ